MFMGFNAGLVALLTLAMLIVCSLADGLFLDGLSGLEGMGYWSVAILGFVFGGFTAWAFLQGCMLLSQDPCGD